MNPTSMLELANRYLNDPQFEERMRQDPEGTAESSGLELDDEDLQSIRDWDMSSSGDEQLKERISKGIAVNQASGLLTEASADGVRRLLRLERPSGKAQPPAPGPGLGGT